MPVRTRIYRQPQATHLPTGSVPWLLSNSTVRYLFHLFGQNEDRRLRPDNEISDEHSYGQSTDTEALQ